MVLLSLSGAKDKFGNIWGFDLKFSHLQKIKAPHPMGVWQSGLAIWGSSYRGDHASQISWHPLSI